MDDHFDVNLQDDEGRTLLSLAVERAPDEVVKLLAIKSIDVNLRDSRGQTPLSYASEQGREKLVMLLLERKDIDVDLKDIDGRTPLSYAADQDEGGEVVKLLLARDDVDVNLKDNEDRTPLSYAAQNSRKIAVELLLAIDGIKVNIRDVDGRTPLSYAAEQENGDEVIKLLLARDDVDVNLKDNKDRTPLSFYTKKHPWGEVAELLFRKLAKTCPDRTPLSWAAENGHDWVVSELLKSNKFDPNSIGSDGRTPLFLAAEKGCKAVTKLLVEYDYITLHLLVERGKQALVNFLLSANYDVNKSNNRGQTPLHIAARSGHLEIARNLISKKANVNAEDHDNATPIFLAVQNKHRALIELLLENSAKVTGVMADEWLEAYDDIAPKSVVCLSEGREKKFLRFIETTSVHLPWAQAKFEEEEKRLFLCPDYSTWERCVSPTLEHTGLWKLKNTQIHYQEQQEHGSYANVCVAVLLPATNDPENQNFLHAFNNWLECGIAWTLIRPKEYSNGSLWKTTDHFSMLPYGWVPEDGVDFFQQFIDNLKRRWMDLCDLAEEHLLKRRNGQLCHKGGNTEFVRDLAEDALKLAKLRSYLQGQVRTAKHSATEYNRCYPGEKSPKAIQEAIAGFSDDVNDRINRLDQTIRDLLQLEFAWVSVNEAHRSAMIATSMKRLSWITFIFLPAMFASSLFGMNVDILKENPDWRWYILFGVGTLILTLIGWLIFKYTQFESWIEQHAGAWLRRWGLITLNS